MRTSADDDLHTLKERQEVSNAKISQGRSCPEVDSFVNPIVHTLLSKNVTTKN